MAQSQPTLFGIFKWIGIEWFGVNFPILIFTTQQIQRWGNITDLLDQLCFISINEAANWGILVPNKERRYAVIDKENHEGQKCAQSVRIVIVWDILL